MEAKKSTGVMPTPQSPAPAQVFNLDSPGSPPAAVEPIIPPVAQAPVVTIQSPLGVMSMAPETSILVDTPETFLKLVNERHNRNFTNLAEAMTLIDEFDAVNSRLGQAQTQEVNFNALSAIIESLPEHLSSLVQAHLDNKDTRQMMTDMVYNSDMNYTAGFEAQDPMKMVNHFTGAGYTKETFEALDAQAKNIMIASAKKEYDRNRAEVTNRPKPSQTVGVKLEQVKTSFNTTVNNLKTEFPTIDNAKVNQIASVLSQGVQTTFINPDGTFKPEAAVTIAYALYGKEMLTATKNTLATYLGQATSLADSKALETVAARSQQPIRPAAGGGVVPTNAVAQEVNKMTDYLRKGKSGFLQ